MASWFTSAASWVADKAKDIKTTVTTTLGFGGEGGAGVADDGILVPQKVVFIRERVRCVFTFVPVVSSVLSSACGDGGAGGALLPCVYSPSCSLCLALSRPPLPAPPLLLC
jgi:hypothetical protein